MNAKTRTLIVTFCVLASSAALANDAVWGALIGGGAGAAIGGAVSGREGAIIGGAIGAATGAVVTSDGDRDHRRRHRVHQPTVVYYTAPPVYYAPAPHVVAPVYYVRPAHQNRHYHHDKWRHDKGHWYRYR